MNNIYNKISEYIEFDLNKIINFENDYAVVFGGAVRDSIANKDIHDVDLLCLSHSARKINTTLLQEGYNIECDLTKKELYEMYKDIHIINEPKTYLKNNKRIQIIIPTPKSYAKYFSFDEGFKYVLSQVDLSNCGVNFSTYGLQESIPDAILHCELNIFKSMKTDMNKAVRHYSRIDKLEKRGWIYYDNLKKSEKERWDTILLRNKKLERIV